MIIVIGHPLKSDILRRGMCSRKKKIAPKNLQPEKKLGEKRYAAVAEEEIRLSCPKDRCLLFMWVFRVNGATVRRTDSMVLGL